MKRLLYWIAILAAYTATAQSDSLLQQDFKKRIASFDSLSARYAYKNDSAGVHATLAKIKSIAQSNNDKELELLTEFGWLNFLLQKNKKYTPAIANAYNLLTANATEKKAKSVLAFAEQRMATFYWEKVNNYQIAFEHYLKSYDYLEKLTETQYPFKQHHIYALGEKYYFFTDYHNALFYLRKALDVKNPHDRRFTISITNTIALAFLGLEQLDSSDYYFHLALALAEQLDNVGWIGNLSGNIGSNQLKRGNYEEAEKWLRRDIELSIQRQNFGSAAGALMAIATINIEKGDMLAASRQIDSAQLFLGNNPSLNRLKMLFPLLSKLNAYKGRWKESGAYLDSALMVKDSMAKRSSALQLLRAQQKSDYQQHKAELDKVENEKRIKTLERNAITIALGLALFGAVLLIRQIRKTRNAKRHSDELLLNILPEDIASELKISGESKARRFNNVTVLFSDFKDFTRHAEILSPEELVTILDSYFKAFDEIVTAAGLEKIKTVGDAYICACGLPNDDPDHAAKVIRVAFQKLEMIKNHPAGWQIRIGIHSGPLVAGIVGIKKFAYDIWGDTVNTAARMEQNSEAGMINISETTYEFVKDKFNCESRGQLAAKNKGEMNMYFVLGEKVISSISS